MKKNNYNEVAILGDGGWGTALGLILDQNGISVTIWSPFKEYAEYLDEKRENSKFLPGIDIPKTIRITSDMKRVIEKAQLIIIAVPSQFVREVSRKMKSSYNTKVPIVSVSKGIEIDSLKRMSQIIQEILHPQTIAVLSGPSHAEEVAQRLPTTVVVSSRKKHVMLALQQLFMTDRFRVYTSEDIVGLEIGGALKNVIAIAAGICDGLCFGANAKAALLTRGIVEITRLGVALGACYETFSGLSGIGDLIATCTSQYGRNRKLGEKLAQGFSLDEIVSSTEMIIEGIKTAQSAYRLASCYSIEMPIITEIYNVIYNNKKPLKAVQDLMMRKPKPESEEFIYYE
ncbi:NAD(P)H-dependent glycerol-3-phosphate dehydrogenase [Chlamydiota bacterium]